MARNGNGNLNLSVTPFEGNPNLLKYFFSQIKSISNINKWSPNVTITYLKSKLAGPALEFVINCPELENCSDIDTFETELTKFFSPQSKTAALLEFNTLTMLPQESVKNLSYRLNKLAAIIYADIQDPAALNIIKFHKLISALPSNLRIKINEENITDYKTAVDRAQTLQDILLGEQLLNVNNTNSVNSISQQLLDLTEKINTLTFSKPTSNENKNTQDKPPRENRRRYSPQRYRENFKTKYSHYKPKSRNLSPKQTPLICQLCGKRYHSASTCFLWQRRNTRNHTENRKAQKNSNRDAL